MTRRRPVSSALSLQATVLVVLTVCALAWVWQAHSERVSRVEAPQNALMVAQQRAREAAVAPYAYATTGDASQVEAARDALAQARAGLGVVQTLLSPPHGAATDPFPATLATLDRLDAAVDAAVLITQAQDPTEAQRATTFAELQAAGEALDVAMVQVQRAVNATLRAHEERVIKGLMALWLGVLVISLGTTLLARWFVASNERLTRRRIHQASTLLAHRLDDAASGASLAGELPDDPLVQPLIEASGRALSALQELRRTNSKLQRTTTFTQDLVRALQLAEDEDAVWEAAAQAAAQAAPGARFQALRLDDDSDDIDIVMEGVEPACAFHSPERCPAILNGQALHHLPGPRLSRCPRLSSDSEAVTCAPITVNGRSVAIAQIMDYEPSAEHFEDFEALRLAVAPRLGVVRSLAERKQQAATDALTGLANRRLLTERLAKMDQANHAYAIVAGDLDHFKRLNDTHGHAAGDACLRLFAQVLKDASRNSDLPARIGGEEFVIVLPNADIKAGLSVAMRVKSYLARATARTSTPFTVSLGVAARPDNGQTAEAILQAADNALYDAKAAGRDTVSIARSGPAVELVADG